MQRFFPAAGIYRILTEARDALKKRFGEYFDAEDRYRATEMQANREREHDREKELRVRAMTPKN